MKTNGTPRLPAEIIVDGKIISENVTAKHNMSWIKQELKKRNLTINEVQYAVVGTNGQLYVDCYKDHLLSSIDK
ncbi:hypothetical protein B0I26_10125 [Anoxybacillus vitaminiphilus]|uniref:Uncharacterized protein n=1 Tax=Paranoxybacillus vitaminiphilus TaxID=581036 RepID=A0A327YPN1_9BACL|nr:hypothetical protein B0I26_10125 [Anoxybacillus vitaminiphilus]